MIAKSEINLIPQEERGAGALTTSDVGGLYTTGNQNDSSFLDSLNRGYGGGDEEVMFIGRKIEKD